MKAIGIVGYKKTGKTTLATALASELKSRGLTVAAAKFSHSELDQPHTDTTRLAQVCDVVAGMGPGSATVCWSRPRMLPDLLPLLTADVLIVEGGKSLSWLPRILLLHTEDEAEALGRDLALGTWNGPDPAGSAQQHPLAQTPGLPAIKTTTQLADVVLAHGFSLPGLDCGACGMPGCRELAAAIVRSEAATTDCKAQGGGVRITSGGAVVALNPFVGRVMQGAIEGMLSALKGYVPGSAVRIELDPEPGGR